MQQAAQSLVFPFPAVAGANSARILLDLLNHVSLNDGIKGSVHLQIQDEHRRQNVHFDLCVHESTFCPYRYQHRGQHACECGERQLQS